MKQYKNHIINLSLLLTLGLFGLASFYPLESMWGINHLQFLPDIFTYFYWVIVIVVLYLMICPIPTKLFDRVFSQVDNLFWGKQKLPKLLFIAGCTVLFYIFRVQTHLLGDGYTLLAIFSQGESYIHKWTQPGSILLIRQIQYLLGGYTRETALHTFQILSILSGTLFLYNIISIIGSLCSTVYMRVLGLSTFLFSGMVLLFFGYVEFYSMSWAVSTLFVSLSLKSLKEERYIWLAIASYLLSLLIHLQAIYFLPGLMYLIIQNIKNQRLRKIGYTLFVISTVIGTVFLIWLYKTKIEFEVLILPLLNGRPIAPDFTVFSKSHLIELANLILLVFPGTLALISLWFVKGKRKFHNSTTIFLTFLSIGSLLFLTLYGAAITMGRDWDIMSLCLLAPLLLVLYQIDFSNIVLPNRIIFNYIIITFFITLSFLSVGTQTIPTENRIYTLLNNRNRNGWIVYANYFLLNNDINRHNEIIQEERERFPNYSLLKKAYAYLERGNYSKAMEIARKLVEKDPYQPDFHQILGSIYGAYNNFEKAEYHFNVAMRLHPYQPTLMNELGQLYMKQGKYDKAKEILRKAHWLSPERTFITESFALTYIYTQQYDSALALADILFIDNNNSPGGLLIKMTVAINSGDLKSASHYYKEYLKYGTQRSDYEGIKKYYQYLNQI